MRSISLGNKVRAASRAISIAKAVKTPKYIVGMKFENTSIENPIIIVIAV